jgi:hypothetical protein
VASLELPAPQFGQLSVSACIDVYFISLILMVDWKSRLCDASRNAQRKLFSLPGFGNTFSISNRTQTSSLHYIRSRTTQ